MNQKIIPHLWFDTQAIEAAQFYTTVFPNAKITHTSQIHDTPSGDCDIVGFQIMDFAFMAISAGPYFKLNPSISFFVNFDPSKDQNDTYTIDNIWNKLSDGGKVLMPLQEYPWSKRYGWVQDKFGVSWQLIVTNPEGDERPNIMPCLLFTKERCGQAEQAMTFWLSVFKDAKKGALILYGANQEPNKEGTVMFADFKLKDLWLAAMDGAGEHNFIFNEAVSFIVNCKDQEEIDYFWKQLSNDSKSEQCGWLKDKFGVSWQIQPENMNELMAKNPKKTTPVMLKMKKIIIKDLEEAGN